MRTLRTLAGPAFSLHTATGFRERLLGLHGVGTLSWHSGLYLSHCRSIHTFWLHESIDVVFLDQNLTVLKEVHRLRPGRLAWCWRASAVLELPAGYCAACPDYLCRVLEVLLRIDNGCAVGGIVRAKDADVGRIKAAVQHSDHHHIQGCQED